MQLRLARWRRHGSTVVVIPWQDFDPKTSRVTAKGHLRFTQLGEIQEVPDSVGYGILRSHGDMIELVKAEPSQRAKTNTNTSTKRVQAPINK